MPKRIGIFLDGTWNEPTDNTNVWRLKLMLADRDGAGNPQISYYDPGVGTGTVDRLRGGLLGFGLSQNIRDAYQWLMEHYEPKDDVYIFGFSRGAFTARSLAGMIVKCGLLRPGAPMPVVQVFERYRRRPEATPLYRLTYQQRRGRKDFDLEERWLMRDAMQIDIKLIGVWDTVGALGIPFGRIPGISRNTLNFHHTRLSVYFERAYQAFAIDEHREAFQPAPWTRFTPKVPDPDDGEARREPIVEQRWFVGAHSNVGGGYRNDPLAQLPLAWMLEKAAETGLRFKGTVSLSGDEHRAPIADSFAGFGKGVYRLVKLGRRFHRQIQRPREDKRTGWVDTLNESVDPSVFKRWREDPSYRPRSLREWAARTGNDLSR